MELAEMQVGQDSPEARFVVSTVAEIEFMLSMFQRLHSQGRGVSVLYGMPLPLSQIDRLASLGRQLGAGSIILILLELFPGRSVTPVCRLWYRGLEALKMRTTAGVELTRVSLITWNACMTKRTGAVSHSTSDFSHGSKTEVD